MAGPHLLVGFGITNRAVGRALRSRGTDVVATDDRPSDDAWATADELGIELVEAPDEATLGRLIDSAARVVPTPGLPDRHPAVRLARERGAEVISEFDLAREWDDRPIVAVTGTDGKTTVTTLVAAMLGESGIVTTLAGNNDTPLVEAIDQPGPEVFVVEASSFRIGHSRGFAPVVATWLNFAPDHLEVHADLAAYEAAKAAIFRHQPADGVAITNADDPVVARHEGSGPARTLTFGRVGGQYRLRDGQLLTDDDQAIVGVAELRRRAPHDIDNALAAAATARSAGAQLEPIAAVLRAFEGLPHRVQLVAEVGGVSYVDDSKATAPHAVLAAITGFERVVLIAGGRNKGLDLGALSEGVDHLIGVVAIGEAADSVVGAFADTSVPVRRARSMDEAVQAASALASSGATVLLSPGCASHDWYANYAERGDDFARAVAALGAGAHHR
jgi:UDP-N-acetylmuramoylalanine--D-glutamate ligase